MPSVYLPLVGTRPVQPETIAGRMADLILHSSWQQRANPRVHPLLMVVAQAKADDMARWEYVAHLSQTGIMPNNNAIRHGYPLPYDPHENNIESVAGGFGYDTPEIVLDAWRTSFTHWRHVAGTHEFFAAQECIGVGYAYTPGRGFFHYWAFYSAPCPDAA